MGQLQRQLLPKNNKQQTFTVIYLFILVLLILAGGVLLPGYKQIIGSIVVFGLCPPLILQLRGLKGVTNKFAKWLQIIIFGALLIVCFFGSILTFLSSLKVDEPYRYKMPGDIIELNDDRLKMNYTVNEHFQMVTVVSRDVTSVFDELVLSVADLFVDGIERLPAVSDQEKKKEKELESLITNEGFVKPIIAALAQSGANRSYNERVAVVQNRGSQTFAMGDMIVSFNGDTVPGNILYNFHDLILNRGKNIKTTDGVYHLEINRDGTLISLSLTPSDMSKALRGVEVRSLISNLNLMDTKIEIKDTGLVGDSAGLTTALEIYMQDQGIDLVKGRKIAATGGIQPNGKVTGIGGLKFKYLAVSNEGCDLFLVPRLHQNELESLFKSGALERKTPVVYVETLKEAIELLKT